MVESLSTSPSIFLRQIAPRYQFLQQVVADHWGSDTCINTDSRTLSPRHTAALATVLPLSSNTDGS